MFFTYFPHIVDIGCAKATCQYRPKFPLIIRTINIAKRHIEGIAFVGCFTQATVDKCLLAPLGFKSSIGQTSPCIKGVFFIEVPFIIYIGSQGGIITPFAWVSRWNERIVCQANDSIPIDNQVLAVPNRREFVVSHFKAISQFLGGVKGNIKIGIGTKHIQVFDLTFAQQTPEFTLHSRLFNLLICKGNYAFSQPFFIGCKTVFW